MNVDRVLWLVSDNVRADYVGYGGGHVHTPNLDALAAVRCQVSGVRCQASLAIINY